MNPGLSYREAAVRGANPVRLVILLYDQAIEDLRQALAAQLHGDIERRTREIDHAILVIGHLQATLDKELGGEVAANLDRFYDRMRHALVQAQCQQSAAALEKCISDLMIVRDAWDQIDRGTAAAAAVPETLPQPESAERHSEWKA